MKKSIFVIAAGTFLALQLISCSKGDSMAAPMQSENQTGGMQQTLAKVGRGMIWADGILFGTVGTPSSFKPTSGPFDELYTGPGFLDGVGAISESKPGDQDFNGGRWHVNALKESVDPGKYAGASSVEELDLSDFTSTDTYFECPLLPRNH